MVGGRQSSECTSLTFDGGAWAGVGSTLAETRPIGQGFVCVWGYGYIFLRHKGPAFVNISPGFGDRCPVPVLLCILSTLSPPGLEAFKVGGVGVSKWTTIADKIIIVGFF